MNKILSPSILACDFSKLGEQIREAENAGATYLHLDVMDGRFVPSISFGMPLIESIRKCSDMIFDVHLMIVEPEKYIGEFAKIGADIISVHVEACESPDTLKAITALGVDASISINPETQVRDLIPYLPYAKQVLFMSVHPGFGGQKFIEESYDRIRELADLRDEMKLDFDIEVDGGVNMENADKILAAGANILVAGSAVFKGDIKANVSKLLEIINR